MNSLVYLWIMLKATLFSTGGSGNIPVVYEEFVPRGWATDRQFAEALAIGQISPGPNGLWIISLGYLTDGLRGALLATIAITLPPLLVLVFAGLYRRVGSHPAVEGFVRGLSLAVIGIFLVVIARLFRSTGIDGPSLLILAVSLGLGLLPRVPVIVLLGIGALLGIVFS